MSENGNVFVPLYKDTVKTILHSRQITFANIMHISKTQYSSLHTFLCHFYWQILRYLQFFLFVKVLKGCISPYVWLQEEYISERIESTSLFNNLFNIHEMVMWSPSQTGGFPPGTPVSSHMKTIRTQTLVPTSMINMLFFYYSITLQTFF